MPKTVHMLKESFDVASVADTELSEHETAQTVPEQRWVDDTKECLKAMAIYDTYEDQIASEDKYFYWNKHAGAYKLKSEISERLWDIELTELLMVFAGVIDDSGVEPHHVMSDTGRLLDIGIKFDFTKEIAGRFAECVDSLFDGCNKLAIELLADLSNQLIKKHKLRINGHDHSETCH